MSLRINSDFNGVTDPDAGAYIAAVEAADGQLLEFGVGKAINDFVVGCKQDRIWDAIKASCILAGARTLSGALVPLAGTAPTPVAFVSGDYNRKTGLVGDGSTKYLDSNRNNNADPQNSNHNAVFVSTVSTSNSALMSATGTTGLDAGTNLLAYVPASGIVIRNRSSTSFTLTGLGSGFKGVSRSTSTAFLVRNLGSITTASVSSDGNSIANTVELYRRSINGGAILDLYSNARLAFYSIGESLDLALLDARVTALITAFAAAIP
jgi:hypothetical protein